jgi:hypothetical protein
MNTASSNRNQRPALGRFADELWIADGPEVVGGLGFHYPTRTAVVRLTGGDLFVWSPVALTDRLQAEVAALGTVRWLVAPNSLHHMFLRDWKRGFPEAKLFGAPGLAAKRADLSFDGELGDKPEPGWAGDLEQVVFRGNGITTEVVFFHRASRTAIFTDLLQHLPHGWYRGWRALVARLDLMTGPEPAVPRKFRTAFRDRPAARAARDAVLSWPVEKVVIAHGAPVESDGGALLRRAFRWLR